MTELEQLRLRVRESGTRMYVIDNREYANSRIIAWLTTWINKIESEPNPTFGEDDINGMSRKMKQLLTQF